MKKIFTLFAALAMVMSMSAAKLYLTPNSNWKESNARFAAYFFGNGDKWISMTKVAGETDLYEVEAPAGYPKVIFCRMNPSSSANNWNGDVKWNQTDDLPIPTDGKNHYTVKAGTWDKGGGDWTIWPVPAAKNYVDVTITVTANAAASIKWHSAGDKLANATDYVAMNAGENNTYTYTLAQVDDFSGVKYTIKVGDVVSEEQTTSTNVTADFKTLMKQAFLKGSMHDWGDKGKMTIADDYLTASIVLSLNAGSYEWKMYVGVDWLGGGKNVTRENNTYELTDGDNCNLTADITGNYTFTWTYATNTLTVTYPAVKYNVNVTAENGTVTGAGEYEKGATATLTAAPAEGYEFVSWTKGEVVVSTENPYTFTVTANVDLVANFKKSVVTHDFSVEDVTVTKNQWSIDLAGSWNEQAFVLRLWQDNTQGFGTYAANAETGYSATLGVKELTPTAEGYYMQDPMNENAFIFQGTMTDGADIYEVYLKGALASESETGEMEAKTEVAFSCNADGVWSIEASADDYSWGLMLEVVPNLETSEYVATGYYVTDIEAGVTEEVAGTGMLYFDDFSGCQVFKGNLTTESGNIYPTLYASSLDLITNEIMTGPSWIGEIAGVDYYEVLLMANNYLWELDLHARNCTGDPGTYTVDIVDVEEGAYSTFMSASAVTGELTIYEDNSYEANVTTVDNEGNPAMSISVSAWAAAAEEYNIVITNATVTENTFGYYIDMIGEWEGHTIKVEVCDELDTETIWANFFIDGGIANDGDQAEGTVEATVNEGVVTITGTFECLGSGAVYNVTISGTLPGGTTTSLDNLNTTVAPVKMIENGQLIIINNGVQYNAQGAVIK